MEVSEEKKLQSIRKDISTSITNEEYAQVITLCRKFLEIRTDDSVIATRVISHLRLRQYEEAILFIDSVDGRRSRSSLLFFELGYALYRLGRYDELSNLIAEAEKSTTALEKPGKELFLKAQMLYRMEKYHEASLLFEKCLEVPELDSPEVRTDYISCLVNSSKLSDTEKAIRLKSHENEENYEFQFNKSLAYLSLGRALDARNLLESSIKSGREVLRDDGVEEEDILDDLSIIETMLAYDISIMSGNENAIKKYAEIMKVKPSDPGVCAIVRNNYVALSSDRDLFGSLKTLNKNFNNEIKSKLTSEQLTRFACQKALLLLKMNKDSESSSISDSLLASPNSKIAGLILKSAILLKSGKYKQAESLLLSELESGEALANSPLTSDFQPFGTYHFVLLISQILLLGQKYDKLFVLLNSRINKEILYRPGFVSVMVALLDRVDTEKEKESFIEEAISYWKEKDATQVMPLQYFLGENLKDVGKFKEAAEQFEMVEIVTTDSNSKTLLEHKIAECKAEYAIEEAEKMMENVRKPQVIDKNITEDGIFSFDHHSSLGASTDGEKIDIMKKKRKKKRKPRLPKDFDRSIPPDPNRWLPKRRRGKRRQRKGYNRSQGDASAGNSSEYKPTGAKNVKESVKQPTQPTMSREIRRKKKKRKGRR